MFCWQVAACIRPEESEAGFAADKKGYLEAHGTEYLLIAGRAAFFVIGVAYIRPLREIKIGVRTPVISSCWAP